MNAANLPKVGPKKAAAIVATLGTDTLAILDGKDAVKKLSTCPGIGRTIALGIKEKWDKTRGQGILMLSSVLLTLKFFACWNAYKFSRHRS